MLAALDALGAKRLALVSPYPAWLTDACVAFWHSQGRDIVAVQSGSAAEEVARQNGYSRPDEHLYLVSAPPAPTPVPTAAPARVQDKSTSALDALRAWWSHLWSHGRRS